MRKAMLIGRHQLLEAQKRALLRVCDEWEQFPTYNSETREKIKEYHCVVVQALPLGLLSELHEQCKRFGKELYQFEQEAITRELVDEQTARALIEEKKDRRTALAALNGEEGYRVIEFKRLSKVLEIKIVTKPVYDVEEEEKSAMSKYICPHCGGEGIEDYEEFSGPCWCALHRVVRCKKCGRILDYD